MSDIKVERVKAEPLPLPPDTIRIDLTLTDAQNLELLLANAGTRSGTRQAVWVTSSRLAVLLKDALGPQALRTWDPLIGMYLSNTERGPNMVRF